MPRFHYTVLDATGREQQGSVDAEDLSSAANGLREQRLLIVDLKPQDTGRSVGLFGRLGGWFDLGSHLPITTRDRVFLLRQLALMRRNGLTIFQALEVSMEQTRKLQMAGVIRDMSEWIQTGHSLSSALKQHPRIFSDITVSLVESAEASGELDHALSSAAVSLERRQELRRQLITSLTYPSIVVLTSIAVATFLVWKVIPKFAAFLMRRGIKLPWSTQLMVDFSGYVGRYGASIAIGILIGVVIMVAVFLMPSGRRIIDAVLLRLFVVGRLLRVAEMVRFCHTMSMLLTSGVTLLESLRLSSRMASNRSFRLCFHNAANQILEGRDLASSIRNPVVPHVVSHIVAVGEQTGSLSDVLHDLGQFYEQELQASIKKMAALVEPVMILIIGGMVGFVYFAFFQAVFQLAAGGR